MSDPNPTTPAVTDPTAPEATPTAVEPTAPVAVDPPADDPTSDDGDKVKKANREAKNLRERAIKAEKEAAELREKVEANELAKLSEKEQAEARAVKAEEQAAAATDRARKALGKAALTAAAADAKLIDPTIVHELLATKLEFDDDGEPTNAADLVKQLVEQRPFLVNQGGAYAGGAPGAAGPNGQPQVETREQKNRRLGIGL